jgi:amino acid adenylation domain-containing protein
MKIPLTISQQGLWYLSQVGHDVSAAYNVVFAFETSSPLDTCALRKSLQFLMLRHPMLGARVCQEDGAPQFEVIERSAELDGSALLSPVVGDLAEVALAESGVSFNFEAGPLFRVALVDDPEGSRYGLVVAFAHLVFDGASLPVFLRDLGHIYAAVMSGSGPDFRDYPLSQEELCRREMEFVIGEDGRSLVERIATRIRDLPKSVSLPTKKALNTRRAVPIADAVELSLPAGTVESIRIFCASSRISPAAFHLAAFEVLLWQYSQQNEFGVSFPVNARDSTEATLTIGYLSNVGVVRASLVSRASVLETITMAADSIFDALEERNVPFPIVVRELKQAGKDLQGPLMQIGFNYQLVGDHLSGQLGDVSIKLVSSPSMYAKNEFKLDVAEAGPDVMCRFIFDQDAFAPSVVERMVSQYSALLASFVANPQSRVQDLPLLTEAERHQVLVEWNDTKADFPQDKCIQQLFEEQVERSPDAVALVFEDQQLTYAQLNAKANQLAHHLRDLGVKPDTLVAICLERSLEMVIGLLGILKAGGAYVPLDPRLPRDRLTYMLADSRACVLVTSSKAIEFLAAPETIRVVNLTTQALPRGGDLIPASLPPFSPAYVIYTSGSTGKPKGVVVPHVALTNFLHSMQRRPGLTADDVLVAVTTFSFDIASLELYGPLMVGARTVLLSDEVLADGQRLVEQLESCGATVLQATPATWRMLIESGWAGSASLRAFCGGEGLPRDLANALLERAAEVWNLYGPTETTVWSTASEVTLGLGAVSIGRPLDNTQVYVVDQAGELLPIGVPGELLIGGCGVASGYHGQPDLTAERFVPDRFALSTGARLYRTGDLARWTSNGQLEHLGRLDHQVKIRGFRIELGEVEAALLRCDAVREAVVLAREDEPRDKRLVAYVVPVSGAPAAADLRTQLLSFLPDYMVPTAWVFLEALPLNPNGKVDRRSLPVPDSSDASVGVGHVAPHTSTEKLLADIWIEVLRAERISIDDNFFVLGGHSLLAAQVIARLRQAGFANVSLRTLLDAPTVRRMAAAVSRVVPSTQSAGLGPISRLSRSV